MKGLLIFDHLNDVVFTKCNKKFANHVQKLARLQGLISESKVCQMFNFHCIKRGCGVIVIV